MKRSTLTFLTSVAMLFSCLVLPILVLSQQTPAYAPPNSPRINYNFNSGWKFIFGDQPGADQPAFDDARWASVSLPHTWNETDTYRAYISHSGGDQSEKMLGIGWYRKHFKLPATANGQKYFYNLTDYVRRVIFF